MADERIGVLKSNFQNNIKWCLRNTKMRRHQASSLLSSVYVIFSATLIFIYSVNSAFSGTIFLKDGSTENSDKIWVSEELVHFVLNGTNSIEIRLSKKIVDKIVQNDGSILNISESGSEKEISTALPKNISIDDRTEDHISNLKEKNTMDESTIQAFLDSHKGLNFYDPRREKRYWADKKAQFNNLSMAVNAMAQRYGRTPNWVERHMGDDNDLSVIHQNLIRTLEQETTRVGKKVVKKGAPDRSVGRKVSEAGGAQEARGTFSQIKLNIERFKGIEFYNPRREQKYWSTPSDHHPSLTDAITFLAKLYGVSYQWIEAHMGDTNELDQIHANLQNAILGLQGPGSVAK
jgi:hypothetical protein